MDEMDKAKPTVKSLFERVERRHETLFDGKGNQKQHLNVSSTEGAKEESLKSDIGQSETLNRLESVESKGGKSAASAKKTKDLLLKSKATGDTSIASEDRMFVVLNFAKDADARKCFFVNKITSTVGDLIEKVGKQFPFPAFKKAMRPDGVSLDIRLLSPASSTARGVTPFGLDRKSLVADIMADMDEVEFSPASSAYLADLSTRIAGHLEDSKRKEEEEESLRLKAAAEEAWEKREKLDPNSVHTGESYRYFKEGVVELVTVTAIHQDDYPNLYFSIQFLSNGYEKQTTAEFLEAITVKEPSGGSGFSVTVTHGIQSHIVAGLSEDMSVAEFKVLVQNATSVAPKNQSLICKGAKLGNDATLLSSTKVKRGSKVMLMGKKK